MAVIGTQYAVTGSAVSLTHADILNTATNTQGTFAQELVIRLKTGATASAYIGPSNVTAAPANAWGEIPAAGEYRLTSSDGRPIKLDSLYVIGTSNAANVLFISAII